MPNWTSTRISCVLPTRKAQQFLNYFLKSDGNKEGLKPYFRRTWISGFNKTDNGKGYSLLEIDCECAWSVYSCMIDPMNKAESTDLITLEDAIRECEVARLAMTSTEEGIGFEEEADFDKRNGEGLHYESRDFTPFKYVDFLDSDIDKGEESNA